MIKLIPARVDAGFLASCDLGWWLAQPFAVPANCEAGQGRKKPLDPLASPPSSYTLPQAAMTTETIYESPEYAGAKTRALINEDDGPGDVPRCFYRIEIARGDAEDSYFEDSATIDFQIGSVEEVGFNGVRDEGLLAVLIHRYEQLQAGPLNCTEIEGILFTLQAAMRWMQSRKMDRTARGVAGTDEV